MLFFFYYTVFDMTHIISNGIFISLELTKSLIFLCVFRNIFKYFSRVFFIYFHVPCFIILTFYILFIFKYSNSYFLFNVLVLFVIIFLLLTNPKPVSVSTSILNSLSNHTTHIIFKFIYFFCEFV